MKEVDRLIYEKSNTYRLHADNLRWTLLGGYAAFFAAATSLLSPQNTSNHFETVALNLLLFTVSYGYLFVLAVQNWFYNLFAKFVKECEQRLCDNKPLRPLEEFAVDQGPYVNPFHPAFFFAELVVSITSFYFLYSAFILPLRALTDTLVQLIPFKAQIVPTLISISFVLVILTFYLYITNYFLFQRWNSIVYKRIIVPFSNLWQPLNNTEENKAKIKKHRL